MRPESSFSGQPIRSLQQMLRTIAQTDPRYLSVIPDGIYGTQTMQAITRFQQLAGLPLTGITDQQTWEQIVVCFENARVEEAPPEPLILTRLDQNTLAIVPILQGVLFWLSNCYRNIPAPSMSGEFDEMTVSSLLAFQRAAALEETGVLDKMTWKYLSLHYALASAAIPSQ